MSSNIGVVDCYLKYDHRKENLIIYISKLHIHFETVAIKHASLKFTLLPNKESRSTLRKCLHKNALYFFYDESLTFKRLKAAQIGSMGFCVQLVSHISITNKTVISDCYLPLDNIDLTSVVTRNILNLSIEQMNYTEEHDKQNSRLLNKQATNISSNSLYSQDPHIAITFKLHVTLSRLDVYIQRVTKVNLFVSKGYFQAGLITQSSTVLSTNKSHTIKFCTDNLVHLSLHLDTMEASMKECGVCVQVIPKNKKAIQINSIKYRPGGGVLFIVFSLENFTSISTKLAWVNFLNGLSELEGRWHKFNVGNINLDI